MGYDSPQPEQNYAISADCCSAQAENLANATMKRHHIVLRIQTMMSVVGRLPVAWISCIGRCETITDEPESCPRHEGATLEKQGRTLYFRGGILFF